MAEVRKCVEWRACELKMIKKYLLGGRIRNGTKALPADYLSVGFLFADIKNRARNAIKKVAKQAAAGSHQDSYAKVSKLLGGAEAGVEKVTRTKEHCYIELKGDVCLNRTLVEFSKKVVPLYRCCDKFWWTSSPVAFIQGQSSLHLDHGSPHRIIARNYSANGSRPEPLYRTQTGYYDILGVSPAATQAQIKTAYYKQSFTYHPDRNSGSEEATVRFSEINEAYTVLGNKGLRKKYDRGLLSLSDLTARPRPSSTGSSGGSAEQQAGSRRSVMGTDLREKIYDFDKFYKAHYGEQLQRQRDIRVRKEDMLKRTQENMEDKTLGRMMEIGVGMLLVFAVGILLSLKS